MIGSADQSPDGIVRRRRNESKIMSSDEVARRSGMADGHSVAEKRKGNCQDSREGPLGTRNGFDSICLTVIESP